MSLDSLVGLGSKELGVRFNLVGVLPTTVLALFFLAGVWSGAPGRSPDLAAARAELAAIGAAEMALLGFAILAVSLVVHPLQLSLVRLLEGYWPNRGPWRLLSSWRIERHRQRRKLLKDQTRIPRTPDGEVDPDKERAAAAANRQLSLQYPLPDRVMPTRLGNVLRAAEDRAGERYGLDTVLVWPRLVPLLSENLTAALEDARNQIDVAARFAVTFGLAVVVALALFAAHGWWSLVGVGAILLAQLSYLAAVNAAVAYGKLMETAFDLHRFDLRKALHVPLPPDHKQELEANHTLSEFLRQDFPVHVEYEHTTPPEQDGDS